MLDITFREGMDKALTIAITATSEGDLRSFLKEFTGRVHLNQVLALPWHGERYERCKEALAEGKIPPPIDVTPVDAMGQRYYLVSDGHHRAAAAADYGHKYILARWSGVYMLHPNLTEKIVIVNEQGDHTVYLLEPESSALRVLQTNVDKYVCALLHFHLECKMFDTIEKALEYAIDYSGI